MGSTVAEVGAGIDRMYAGLAAYPVDERGALRHHSKIIISHTLVNDRQPPIYSVRFV